MNSEKIKIFGEEVAITFNPKVQIAFERITDKAFDLALLSHIEYRFALYFAAIISSNPDTKITMDNLLESSLDDMTAIDTALNESMRVWYKIPAPAEQNAPADEPSDSDSKN